MPRQCVSYSTARDVASICLDSVSAIPLYRYSTARDVASMCLDSVSTTPLLRMWLVCA